MRLRRRDLISGAAAGLTTLPFASGLAQGVRRYRIGHTGITWGYAPQNAEQAIADVGALGYHGFESFGSVIEFWESRGGIGQLLDAAGLGLVGAYCPMILTDASQRAAEVEKIVRWGNLIRRYGGTVAVIGPDNVDRERFRFGESFSTIVATLNELGMALADIGLSGALHQHTGSCITTRDETYAIIESVNGDVLTLCPDTGELLAAGIDPVDFIRYNLPRISHVHIKDFNGGEFNDGYCPVGTGRVDVEGVIDVLETAEHDFMIMAELNPNPNDLPAPPLELAATSRTTFQRLGYSFR